MIYAEINVSKAKKRREVRKEGKKKKFAFFERSYFGNCFGTFPSFLSWVRGSQLN